MRVARLNFSHGSHEYHCQTIKAVREAVNCYAQQISAYKPVAIALDTKGPEIRTGQLSGSDTAEIELKQGDKIKLSTNKSLEASGSKDGIYVDYPKLPKIVKPRNLIFIDDGLISLIVKEVSGEEVVCQVLNGGKIGSRKGVNLPGIPVDLPSLSDKDVCDLQFGIEQDVDMIFASFIRNATALAEIREVLGPKGKRIKIISKIENQQGMQNIDAIIAASDGIMVARGDLGIEILTEEVVLAQKSIIAKCNKVGKPVICATQMLDSMIGKPRPTRAEASDVANAIFDGADCVMLSGETAKGKFPVECIKCMANICAKVENVLWYERLQNDLRSSMKASMSDNILAITSGITEIATLGQANAIVIASPSPVVAQLVSQFRPKCPIVFLTGSPRRARQSIIFRGVYPIVPEEMVNGCKDFARILTAGIEEMTKMQIVDADKPMKLMIVNALEAEKISFRLLYVKHKSEEEKCKEAAEAKARLIKAEEKKSQKRKSCAKKSDQSKSPEQIERCKKLAEKREKLQKAKTSKSPSNDEEKLRKCMAILAEANKEKDDKC
ncbi:pyruvate kinase [Drosophila novamexicana]|uniref:pyruvate kinase n=1 Tax=Drosophila novamexicana TaxID=47314 RepID=UPI0011E5F46A|nr:pyruvate kinase [Drosophila novamexicana]